MDECGIHVLAYWSYLLMMMPSQSQNNLVPVIIITIPCSWSILNMIPEEKGLECFQVFSKREQESLVFITRTTNISVYD